MNSFKSAAKDIWAKPYARRLTPEEGGGYSAQVQEFPGCFAYGDTADEALQRLDGAALSWIEAQLSLNQKIPDPIDFDTYSGRIALRIPRGLHKQAAELAALEGSSLNQLLTAAISSYVSQKLLVRALKSEMQKFKEVVQQIGLLSLRIHQSASLSTTGKARGHTNIIEYASNSNFVFPQTTSGSPLMIEKRETTHG